MIAVLTGDVVNSRKLKPEEWLIHLKNGLQLFGKEPLDWEIYRGDSFQIKTTVEKALLFALILKAWMKQLKEIDVRISIGVGKESFKGTKLTEANGTAFELSGLGFDRLNKQHLSITTDNLFLNDTFKVMCDLSLLTMDKWSNKTAEIVFTKLQNPTMNQTEIAVLLGKKQGNISESLKRAGYDEMIQFITYYQREIKNYVATAS